MVEPSVQSLRDRADQLDQQKRIMETRLQEIIHQLDTMPGKPGLHDQLVDEEGFPRNDVDVYLVRQLRNEHIRLHNDLRGTMDELHRVLNSIHTAIRNSTPTVSPPRFLQTPPSPNTAARMEQPFAVVQFVEPNSPAYHGGLKLGDKVLRFGDAQGPAGLTVLQSRLQAYQDKAQQVTVQRQGALVELAVTPKTWAGQGILGSTLIPM